MSQKVNVAGFRLTGHVYQDTREDGSHCYLAHGIDVAKWLGHNYRVRFNQQRSLRSKYVFVDGKQQFDADGDPSLVSIAKHVTELTNGQAKASKLWMAAMPTLVLNAATQDEVTTWFGAAKRRKTNREKGVKAGAMPRFKKNKPGLLSFKCGARNGSVGRGQDVVSFHRTGSRSGVVKLRGFNPRPTVADTRAWKWELNIKVRLPKHMVIEDFTSVQVNVDTMTLTFTSPPAAIKRVPTGKLLGVDVGVNVLIATSDGELLNPEERVAEKLKELGKKYKKAQKMMARSQIIAKAEGRDFRASNRYQVRKAEAAKISRTITNIRTDFRHKATHAIIRDHDYVAVEKLGVKNMTRSAKGTVEKPGKNVAQKRGLNRSMAAAAPATILGMIAYKAKASGVHHVPVDPKYTSQRCNQCGHIEEGNRESQAFLCLACGHTDHADVNAAKNILDRGSGKWGGKRPKQARP